MSNGIINYLRSFEDACILLRIDIKKFNEKYKYLTKSELASKKLKLIIKVLNNDWIPKLDGKEYMYTPYFKYDGIYNSFSYYSYYIWGTSSVVGFGWGFKNEELMMHCVNNFLDLWNDYLSYDTNDDLEEIWKDCKVK